MSDMQKRLFAGVEKMPAFPESVHQIMTLTSDVNCSQKELVEVIKRDPVLTLKILRMVNSVFFGLSREVTSVNQASVYLGLNTLKNTALGLAAIGALPKDNEAGFDMDEFWMHSLTVAQAARMLSEAKQVPRERQGDFFAAGLLHDVGKVVLALYAPVEFRQAMSTALGETLPLYRCESEIFGLTHTDVGARLAKQWNLPGELVQSIAGHHAPSADGSELANAIFVADLAARRLAKTEGAFEKMPEALEEEFFGGMQGVMQALVGIEAEVEKARMFVQVGRGDA